MRRSRRLLLFLVLFLFASFLFVYMSLVSRTTEHLVSRPDSVPADAVAAVGPDGGSWARCEYDARPKLYCETYFSRDGAIWTRGRYVLVKDGVLVNDVEATPIGELMSGFTLYDGIYIHLETGSRLVPDGVIDSPFRGGGGKKREYSMGEAISAEIQY